MVLKIRRFDPERDTETALGALRGAVPPPGDRLLDALHWVKWNLDGSLAFRRACDQGSCGVRRRHGGQRGEPAGLHRAGPRPGRRARVERSPSSPSRGLPSVQGPDRRHGAVLRRRTRAVSPWLIPGGREDILPNVSSRPQEVKRFAGTATKCILCAACTFSLPGVLVRRRCSGPARSSPPIGSSSTAGTPVADQRFEILNDREGVWRCRTTFNCTEGMPPRDRGDPGGAGGQAGAYGAADLRRFTLVAAVRGHSARAVTVHQSGELVAGFRVERLIGSGGMGEVYLVHHPRLPRLDALKLLPCPPRRTPATASVSSARPTSPQASTTTTWCRSTTAARPTASSGST